MKIDNLPKVMGDGASINVNQVSVIVNQLKADLNECVDITKSLEMFVPNSKELPFSRAVNNFKLSLISKSLTKSEGNQSEVARELGINRTTLVAFLDKQLPTWRKEL